MHMVTASHQLNILHGVSHYYNTVQCIRILCNTQLKHILRKSNHNKMQLLILILWSVLSEDAIKHVWYPMVSKSKKHEHNCYMHQLWSMRKYCRITPSFIPRSSQSLSLTLCWEGLGCSYHIICRTDSLAVHTGHVDLWHLCHKSCGKNSTPFNILQELQFYGDGKAWKWG